MLVTAPTPEQLRDAAWEKYASLNGIHPHSIDRDTFNEGWDAAAEEVDRLRAVIERAPHEPDCPFLLPIAMRIPEDKCDCWKADAL